MEKCETFCFESWWGEKFSGFSLCSFNRLDGCYVNECKPQTTTISVTVPPLLSATVYSLDDRRVVFRFPAGAGTSLFATASAPVWDSLGPTRRGMDWLPLGIFAGKSRREMTRLLISIRYRGEECLEP